MKIIAEEQWSYVLFEHEEEWILTILVHKGPVSYDVCIKLTSVEIKRIKADESQIKLIVEELRADRIAKSRHVQPPLWPHKV